MNKLSGIGLLVLNTLLSDKKQDGFKKEIKNVNDKLKKNIK